MANTDPQVRIAPYEGERDEFAALFELADDSPVAVAGYRDLGTLLVARDGTGIVGLALVVPGLEPCCAELKSLAVTPPRQGGGLGTLLVHSAIATATEHGATKLEVSTASADIGNLRFYQRVGFRMVRILMAS